MLADGPKSEILKQHKTENVNKTQRNEISCLTWKNLTSAKQMTFVTSLEGKMS